MAAKIVIVEDDVTLSQMYRFKFEAEGFEVDTAENGKLGLSLIETTRPDLVLLDLMMPEMPGDVMLEQLRQTDWGKDIKVVVLTNLSESEVPESVRQNGVSAVALKADMSPRQVIELAKEVLGM